ncbi:MAG: SapC family protein [Mycobacterium sp.]|nr:SapC family protein [Mycobacterium sp.]
MTQASSAPTPPTARFTPVGRERHADWSWRSITGFSYAAATALVPLVGAELAKVALAMPFGFNQRPDGRFVLVGILSLTPGRNLFVAPDGRWLGDYVPAAIRSHPFRLLREEGTEALILCVDEQSGLVGEGGGKGQAFFDGQGNLAPPTKAVLDFLGQIERNRAATEAAVSELAAAGVICPWPIKLKSGEVVDGLHRIDERAVNALQDDAFLRLRKSSALPIAYAQLLSMGKIQVLERLAELQSQLAPTVTNLPESLDKIFQIRGDELICFD